MGFFIQNIVAIVVGLVTSYISYHLLDAAEPVIIATIGFCGFIGGHLPHIQQPSQPSYRVLRMASWLTALLIPLANFLYRPIDLLPAWIVAFLLTTATWMIIDRISLLRDYTRSVVGIILLPLLITTCAYSALGNPVIIPAFLACSTSYIVFLLTEQYTKRNWLRTLKDPTQEVSS
uniref:Uncharacterized protein n=1 Tax=uncultured Thiotrichaceae bacterium TaxID=298394 RepID=A0A6S6U3Q8_9GAMM|nr:MAG: Unknown protein [uncultured Thiotrichaceae bacterium]